VKGLQLVSGGNFFRQYFMPPKGIKKAKSEEGYKSDSMSDDVQAGQTDAAQISMHVLTPKIPVVAQEQSEQPLLADNFTTAFTTPAVGRDKGDISPDFRLDNEPNLLEQFELAKRERRYEDAKRLKAMFAQQSCNDNVAR
jgi:hypothetical protein